MWKERNSRTFEVVAINEAELESLLFLTLFAWSHAWGFTSSDSFTDFKLSLNFVHDTL